MYCLGRRFTIIWCRSCVRCFRPTQLSTCCLNKLSSTSQSEVMSGMSPSLDVDMMPAHSCDTMVVQVMKSTSESGRAWMESFDMDQLAKTMMKEYYKRKLMYTNLYSDRDLDGGMRSKRCSCVWRSYRCTLYTAAIMWRIALVAFSTLQSSCMVQFIVLYSWASVFGNRQDSLAFASS